MKRIVIAIFGLGVIFSGVVITVSAAMTAGRSAAVEQPQSAGTTTPFFTPSPETPGGNAPIPPLVPIPDPYFGPTITPSGPLFPVDRRNKAQFYAGLPTTVGSVRVITYQQSFGGSEIGFVLENTDGARHTVQLFFYPSASSAYFGYQTAAEITRGTQQAVPIGDKAFIARQGEPFFMAAMQYRNVLVQINNPATSGSLEPAVRLTDQQLIAVLQTIYVLLEGRSLAQTSTPIVLPQATL